jgi:predicted ATPase/DNA-binding SARP family transcriptional activator
MLEARFLGKFDIRSDGESIELPARKAQSLLAYLMMTPGTMHRREQLAGYLWPESDEASARSRLRYALWQLRKAIGKEYFLADKISIAFNQEMEYWLDCDSFQVGELKSMTTDALALELMVYKGEFLPGFYEDWVLLTRDRLHATYERRMIVLLGGLSAEKHWAEVLEWAERWISVGAPSEPAYQALMVAHAQLGDKAGATNAYQRCRRSLDEQLGVEPAELTEQIYQLILNSEIPEASLIFPQSSLPIPSMAAQPAHTSLPASDHPVFVTRESELSWLDHKLEKALGGQGQVAFVVGDAGQGKTTLLREFSQRAQQLHGALIVAKGSNEAYTGIGDPYLPFREVIALLTGDVELGQSSGAIDQENAGRLWKLIPETSAALVNYGPDLIDSFIPGEALLRRASAFGSGKSAWLKNLNYEVDRRKNRPVPLNIDHGDSKQDLFEQYTKVLQELAGNYPILLILDDLQWADLGTISLLFHLARRIEGHRILILGAFRQDDIAQYRDDLQHPLVEVLAELKRIFGDTQIDLDQASKSEGRIFIDKYLDTEPNNLDDEFRQALFLLTAGHPLFTVELLRQMQDQGDIYKDEQDRWEKDPGLDWGILPAKVEAVIERRVGRLPAALREIINIGSVEGEEFTAELIAKILNQEEIDIVRQLSQELDKQHRLIEARGIKNVGDQRFSIYGFRHILFQKFIYGDLDLVERAHLHQRVGDGLEKIYGEHKAEIVRQLARQYEQAGVMEKTIDYLLMTGNQAKRVSANEQAVAFLTKGLDLLKDQPGGSRRDEKELALQIALGAPMVATLGYASKDVERTFERARELCERTGDSKQLAPALWGLCSFYQVRGRHTTAYEMAQQILVIAEDVEDTDLMLLAHWMLGTTLTHLGEFSSARENLEQALMRYEESPEKKLTYAYGQNPAVTCLNYLAINLWVLGYLEAASEKCEQAISVAKGLDHPYSQAFAHGMAALFHAIKKDAGSTLDHSEETLRLAKESNFPFFLALGLVLRGWVRAKSGKAGLGIKLMQRGIEGMQLIGTELGGPFFSSLMAEGYEESREFITALEVVEDGLEKANATQEQWSEFDLCLLKGSLLRNINGGDYADSLSWYQKAMEVAHRQDAKSYELQVAMTQVRHSEGPEQLEVARADLAKILDWFSRESDSDLLREAKELLKITAHENNS